MKWIKHATDFSRSEEGSKLLLELGLDGYARWWILQEIVGDRMDETSRCYAEYSAQKWGELLHCKQKILKTFLEHSGNILGIFWESHGDVIKISIPKLLLNRDNYTKNLQAKKKTLASRLEVEVDNNTPLPPLKGGIRIKKPSARIRVQAFTEDMQPDDYCTKYAQEHGINGHIEQLWRRFVDYHLKNGKTTKDLHASWRTFVGNAPQYNRDLFSAPVVRKICPRCNNQPYFDGYHKPCPVCREFR